jgi:hypothetical protein
MKKQNKTIDAILAEHESAVSKSLVEIDRIRGMETRLAVEEATLKEKAGPEDESALAILVTITTKRSLCQPTIKRHEARIAELLVQTRQEIATWLEAAVPIVREKYDLFLSRAKAAILPFYARADLVPDAAARLPLVSQFWDTYNLFCHAVTECRDWQDEVLRANCETYSEIFSSLDAKYPTESNHS